MRRLISAFLLCAMIFTMFTVSAYAAPRRAQRAVAISYFDEYGNKVLGNDMYYDSNNYPRFGEGCYYYDENGNEVFVGGCRVYYLNANGKLIAGRYFYDTNGNPVSPLYMYKRGGCCNW